MITDGNSDGNKNNLIINYVGEPWSTSQVEYNINIFNEINIQTSANLIHQIEMASVNTFSTNFIQICCRGKKR